MVNVNYVGLIREPLESLGDSITTAVLLSWSKKPGDGVKEDDIIGVVETDKVCFYYYCCCHGIVVI